VLINCAGPFGTEPPLLPMAAGDIVLLDLLGALLANAFVTT
jgi:hypothetical protein